MGATKSLISAVGRLDISSNADPGTTTNIALGGQNSTDSGTPRTVSLRTAQAAESIGTFTASHKLRLFHNGTEYHVQLDAV
jgi:hypothetical protein